MKTTPRARLAAAGLAVLSLTATTIGASEMASASTEPVTASLPAPTALTPDDSTKPVPHAVLKTVRLDWAPVSGASGYRVQVGTDSTWSDDPTLTRDVVSSELTLPVWLPHASYVWRVAALQGSNVGHWSSESSQRQPEAQFTRGWRDAPTLNAVAGSFEGRPTYSWAPVTSASGYQLQVSTDPFFGNGPATAAPDTTPSATTQTQAKSVHDTCFTPRTRVTAAQGRVGADGSVGDCSFTSPDPGTTLYWRVRGLDRFVDAAQPVDTTPASKAGISYQPPATDGIGSDVTSDCPGTIDPSASATPAASASSSASATPTASASASAGSTGGCDPAVASEASAWSTASSFTYSPVPHVEGYTPATVTTASLGGDVDGLCTVTNAGAADAEKALCRDMPTISWSRVPGALRYRVYVGLDDSFGNIQTIVETSALQFTPTYSLRDSSPSESYYYVVQACDLSACGPVTSTPRSFRKVSDRPATGTKPGVIGDPELSWSSYAATLATATGKPASQDAYGYHLQVASADHPSYDTLVDEATVDQTSYVPADREYGDGQFVWRVQAVDSSGHKLPWSLSQSFTRDATAPRIVSASPGSRIAVNQAVRVVFSEVVTGLSSSTLTLSPATPTTVRVLDGKTATVVPTRPLLPGATYQLMVGPSVKDVSGNSAMAAGPRLTVNALVDDASRALTYAGAWRTLASSNATGGSYHAVAATTAAQGTASLLFRGTGVALTTCLGPSNGLMDLYVDGVRKSRISTYRSFSGCGLRIASLQGLARGQHTFKLVGIGAHSANSKGNAVSLDALTVTP